MTNDNTGERIILVFGPEPLIIEEALDAIRQQNPDAERLRFGGGERIDWPLIEGINREIPMLASQRLVEIRVMSDKLDAKASQAILDICADPSPDCTFVLVMAALAKAELNKKWFKTLSTSGRVLRHQKIDRNGFAGWVRTRLKSRGVAATPDAIERIVFYLEGNLLAASQYIDLIALTTTDTTLDGDMVSDSIAANTQFGPFALSDCLMAGDGARALRVLEQLRSEGMNALAINGTLARELNMAAEVARAQNKPEKRQAVSKRLRLWPAREKNLAQLARRVGRMNIDACIQRCAAIDAGVKGRRAADTFNVWDELEQVVLLATNHETLAMPVS